MSEWGYFILVVGFFIALGSKSSNPFLYLTFLRFTLLIFYILVIHCRIPLRYLLLSCFVLCSWRLLLIVLWIAGQWLSPSLSLSYWDCMIVSMALANFSLLWMEIPLSPQSRFLMEAPLHSDGLCTLQFPRSFPSVSLLQQLHAVPFQVLILGSLSSGLMFFFIQVRLSLESLTSVFLGLDSFLVWSILLVLFLRF